MDDLKQSTKRIAREVRKQSSETGRGRHNINVAGRTNVAAAGNFGEGGSTHSVSATQKTRIRQNGSETTEETVVGTSEEGGG